MSLKLYIAGASAEIDAIEPRVKRLREAGAEITGDWCADIRRAGTANAGLIDNQRYAYAIRDFSAVVQAEVFWLIVPRAPSIGCWVEFGVTQGRCTRIVVSEDDKRTIFTALAHDAFTTHDEAEAHLMRWVRRGAHPI